MEEIMRYEGLAQLRSEGGSLEIRLDENIGGLLTRFHFTEGQEVRVRISDEKLEIRPRKRADDIQAGLHTASVLMKVVGHDLRTLRSQLPDEPLPEDPASFLEEHLGVAIDCLLVDLLDPAVTRLTNAAHLTAADLRTSSESPGKD